MINTETVEHGDSLNMDMAGKEESEMMPRVLSLGNQKIKVKEGTLGFKYEEMMERRSLCHKV